MSKFNDPDSGNPRKVEPDTYAELFADCETPEDILELQAELDEIYEERS